MVLPAIASSAAESVEPPTKPLADLPKHIQPVSDKLTLVADFQNKKEGIVSMYLINATKAEAVVPTQDGNLYCKRTAQGNDGRWQRCDSHQYSYCGNSYISTSIPAGGFLSWPQRCDSVAGAPRKIRFRLFQEAPFDVESNEGFGNVGDAEIQTCRYDAMAMRDGPFEDVAAVATGKVKGGQGASIDGMDDALRGLGRHLREKELFSVIKQIISKLAKTPDPEPRLAFRYSGCLQILGNAMQTSLEPEKCWEYVMGQVRDETFPWRNEALDWLVVAFSWQKDRLKPLIESVLAKPGHPAMRAAAFCYAKAVPKHAAGIRLESISNDATYPPSDRQLVREAREGLYENPFLGIDAVAGDAIGPDGDVAPLKTVTITNISPQPVNLPVAEAADLLVICLRQERSAEILTPAVLAVKAGKLELPPGGTVELHDFKWWTRLDPGMIKPDEYYSGSFQATSPGLWEVKAKPNWSWGFKGEKILKAINLEQKP